MPFCVFITVTAEMTVFSFICMCVCSSFFFLQGKTSPPTLLFNRLFSDIKEEPGHPTLVHPRYYTLFILIKQHRYTILGLQLMVIFNIDLGIFWLINTDCHYLIS